MSTVYTPSGQVPPVPDITIPQDVIDAVVVGSVNPAFQALADNIAWQLLAQKNVVNAANYGVVADGTTDNAAGLAAAEAALHAAGGGTLLLPAGRVKSTAQFGIHADVSVYAPQTTFAIDDPSAICFYVIDGTAKQTTVVYIGGVEADQANSGTVFDSNPSLGRFIVVRALVNTELLLLGALQSSLFNPATFIECTMTSCATTASMGSGVSLEILGGELIVNPAISISANLIESAGELLLSGVKLTRLNGTGVMAFVGTAAGPHVRLIGNVLNVTPTSGAFTYFLDVTSGSRIQMAGNIVPATDTSTSYYRYVSGPIFGAMQPLQPDVAASAGSATVKDDTNIFAHQFTSGSAPTITLPHIMTLGQELDMMIFNNQGTGTSWTGAPVFVSQGSDDIKYSSTGLDGLPIGGILSLRWRATRNPITPFFNTWVQIGAPIQI